MELEKSQIDRIFHALGDPTRRAMLERIGDGPITVTRLAQPFGITLAAVVQHLQILEACGLVKTEKHGRVRTCRVEPQGLDAAIQWIEARKSLWHRRVDRLGALLAEPDPSASPAEEPSGDPEWLG